jgi:KDO2-lipid IV(A) lauroyltransferase
MLVIRINPTDTMGKMNFKKIRYGLGDLVAYSLFLFFIPIFRSFPPKALIPISRIMGAITFYLFRKYRERVIGNLLIAFGREKDLSEIKIVASEVFFHFTLTTLETIYLMAAPFDRFLMEIQIEGREYLDASLAKGNGVIALGAHLGSFTLLGTRLALEGYPFNVVIKEGNFPKLLKRLAVYQDTVRQRFFPPKPSTTSVKKSLNCLHRNEILYLIADEQQRRRGLPVIFFGQKAFTPSGPAILSLKTGAPILPMFVLRENGIKRTLLIGSPIEIERTSDEQRDILRLTAKFTNVIEEMVRQYPSQWAWLNRRWKQPRQNRKVVF